MTRRPTKAVGAQAAPRRRQELTPWVGLIADRAAERALPDTWPIDFADRFEPGWRKTLKQEVPPEWPASFREKLLGVVYREFLDRLRAEDMIGALKERVRDEVADQTSPHMTRSVVKRIANGAAAKLAEAWIEPLLEEAALIASARIEDEIDSARAMIRRIRQLRPNQLHRFASQYNWDDGYLYLFEVIRSPSCALRTAVMLYRVGRPHCFLQYKERREVPGYCVDNYDLLVEIEDRIREGAFVDHAIRESSRLSLVDPMVAPPLPAARRRGHADARFNEASPGGASRASSAASASLAPLQSSRQVKTSKAGRRQLSAKDGPTRAAR